MICVNPFFGGRPVGVRGESLEELFRGGVPVGVEVLNIIEGRMRC